MVPLGREAELPESLRGSAFVFTSKPPSTTGRADMRRGSRRADRQPEADERSTRAGVGTAADGRADVLRLIGE